MQYIILSFFLGVGIASGCYEFIAEKRQNKINKLISKSLVDMGIKYLLDDSEKNILDMRYGDFNNPTTNEDWYLEANSNNRKLYSIILPKLKMGLDIYNKVLNKYSEIKNNYNIDVIEQERLLTCIKNLNCMSLCKNVSEDNIIIFCMLVGFNDINIDSIKELYNINYYSVMNKIKNVLIELRTLSRRKHDKSYEVVVESLVDKNIKELVL